MEALVYSRASVFSVTSRDQLLIAAVLAATSASKDYWLNASSSVNLAMEAIKLEATSFNKSATF